MKIKVEFELDDNLHDLLLIEKFKTMFKDKTEQEVINFVTKFALDIWLNKGIPVEERLIESEQVAYLVEKLRKNQQYINKLNDFNSEICRLLANTNTK